LILVAPHTHSQHGSSLFPYTTLFRSFLSLVITLATASLLFLSVQTLIVTPIQRVIASMATYAKAPEDARSIIAPDSRVTELRARSEEHTSELQSRENLVCRLLLEKKK